jgi:hypothetical protein
MGGLRWRLVQIHVAAQPYAFETSHRRRGGAALSQRLTLHKAAGSPIPFCHPPVGTSEFGKCQVRLSTSCRVPKQTSGKMSIPLLFLTVLQSSLAVAGAEQTGQNATAHTKVGWVCDADNKRSTLTLLYNCLFTIFLCTWSAMHLNVPGEKDTQLRTFLRKCTWMLLGVLAPEYVAFLAIVEWDDASRLVRQVRINPTVARDDERS